MPIDASLYSQIKPIQIENPLEVQARISQFRGMQSQNRLAELALGQKEREIDFQGKRRNALASALNPETGQLDDAAYTKGLAGIGDYEGLKTFEKDQLAKTTAQREAEKVQLETAIKKQKVIAQYAGAAVDQVTWDQGLADLNRMGVDVSQVPRQYDSKTAEILRNRALSGEQQLEQKRKAMDADYRARNDAANRNVTVRGQNLTDARGREANRLKGEENSIKRNEKRATADLTRGSQIASFDTMLGTLDRLAKHPGLSRSVGFLGALPTRPGSESANFQAELNTFQSQAFLPMVAQLKGMGALSDAEGKKLTAAVGALDPMMGEKAFRDSVARITADMESARQRMAGEPRQKDGEAPSRAGALSPEEQSELEQLRKQFGRK